MPKKEYFSPSLVTLLNLKKTAKVVKASKAEAYPLCNGHVRLSIETCKYGSGLIAQV